MKTVVILTCHNQNDIINVCQNILDEQTVKPDKVLIVDDHSDIEKSFFSPHKFTEVIKTVETGRCQTRNTAIKHVLNDFDLLIFMDGDSVPQNYKFVERYQMAATKGQRGCRDNRVQAIFGMRQHIFRPTNMDDFNHDFTYESIPISNLPSDLLTANMGNEVKTFDPTDLRIVSGAFEAFNKTRDINTRLALLTSGLLTWSCNFAITKEALEALVKFRKKYFGQDNYFDTETFKDVWGGEDNIFGFDLVGAGVDIKLIDDANTFHFMHERSSDNLFDYMREIPIRQERYYRIRQILEEEKKLRRELHDIMNDHE